MKLKNDSLIKLFPQIKLPEFEVFFSFFTSNHLWHPQKAVTTHCLNEGSECFKGTCLKGCVKRGMYKQDLLKHLSNFCNKRFDIRLPDLEGISSYSLFFPSSVCCLDLYGEARHDDLGLIWHLSSQVKRLIHHNRHCHKWVLRSLHKWRQMMHLNTAWISYIKHPISLTFPVFDGGNPAFNAFEIHSPAKNKDRKTESNMIIIQCSQSLSTQPMFSNVTIVIPFVCISIIMRGKSFFSHPQYPEAFGTSQWKGNKRFY